MSNRGCRRKRRLSTKHDDPERDNLEAIPGPSRRVLHRRGRSSSQEGEHNKTSNDSVIDEVPLAQKEGSWMGIPGPSDAKIALFMKEFYDSEDDQDHYSGSESNSNSSYLFSDEEAGDEDEASESPRVSDSGLYQVPAVPQPAFVWTRECPQTTRIPFTGTPGLKVPVPQEKTPLNFFKMLADDNFFDLCISKANELGQSLHQEKTRWRPLTKIEFTTWLGLLLHMGTVKCHRIPDYWKKSRLFSLELFSKMMARDRFLSILRSLNFCGGQTLGSEKDEEPGNQDTPPDPLMKIRPLLDFFHNKMSEIYYPDKNLFIDKPMVFWKGRIVSKQYVKVKTHKFGLKMYMLTEVNGMVQKIIINSERNDQDLGGQDHASRVVTKLMEDNLGVGHSLFMDNFFNDLHLTQFMLHNKTYVSGILRNNSQDIPRDELYERWKIGKGQCESVYSQDGICVLRWNDRKESLFISSEFKADMEEVVNRKGKKVKKPQAIAKYYESIGEIDKMCQIMTYYSLERKALRWYKKMSIHIIQVIVFNSFVLYNKYATKKVSFYDYRNTLVDQLLPLTDLNEALHQKDLPTWVNPTHFPRSVPSSEKGKKLYRRCRICQLNMKRTNSGFYCPGCKDEPGLCLDNCFVKWHNDKE